ncbi:MAG: hypothetical protein ACKO92_05855, partial [Actinomycetota bacterium]
GVADELNRLGWYVDRQSPPDSLHCTVNAIHHDKIQLFSEALTSATQTALHKNTAGQQGAYGTLD